MTLHPALIAAVCMGWLGAPEGPSPRCWRDRQSPWQRRSKSRHGTKPPTLPTAERRRRKKAERDARKHLH